MREPLLPLLHRLLVPEACLGRTQMVPLHQDTIREIVEAIETRDNRITDLVTELDRVLGTPCEQIRRQQEREA